MSKRKLKDANNNPVFIVAIGVLFLVAGIAVAALGASETWVLVVGILLAVCGAIFVPYGIYRGILIKKVNSLKNDPEAFKTEATFVKAVFSGATSKSTSIRTGNVNVPTSYKLMIFKKIVYTYKDQNGMTYKAKSAFSFAPNQAKFLEEKKTFAILCKGKVSLIVEEVPEAELTINY